MKIVIGIHVDDLLITGPCEKEIVQIKDLLKGRFEMKDLGKAKNILGIRITQTGGQVKIDQSKYAKTIVSDFSISGSKIHSTPMASDAVGELERTPGRVFTEEELNNY